MFHSLRVSSLSPVVLLPAVLLGILLLAPIAHTQTGTYVWRYTDPNTGQVTSQSPAFSGGTFYDDARQPNGPYDYESGSGGYGGGTGTGDSSCQTSSSGDVTATFTWLDPDNPNEPAPSCVMAQTSTTQWYANGYFFPPPALCNDGLDDPEIDNGSGETWSGRSAGTQYSAGVPQSDTITVKLMGAQASVVPGNNNFGDFGSSVEWGVDAYPVTISLGGTAQDGDNGPILDSKGNQQILVGQSCSAGLSISGLPSGCTVSDYQWSVSGITFKTWSPTTPADQDATPPRAANSQASYEVDGYGPANYSGVQWYWNDPGPKPTPETVTCTATVTPPAGQGVAFQVTATQNVLVYVPNWTATGTGGDLQVNNTKPPSDGIHYQLHAGPTNSPADTGGMDWRVTVTSPNSALFADGSPQMVQIITYGASFTIIDANKVVSTYNWSQNKQKGLDGAYPYGWAAQPPQYPTYIAGDLPGFEVDGVNTATLNDAFEDTLMYLAPGSSQPVPLASFKWSTSGTATVPGTGDWKDFGTGSAGFVTPSGSAVNFSPSNTFPSWTTVLVAANGSFVKAN